ncbi:MAG: helix-turn-helix transcriptional regulator [Lachnospiraceae bacterium]|nr:helix-turn-helix transcriptional regulator [Lachnospiraceae bacterium]
MQTGEIGKMIYSLRLEKNMSQEDLCRGICSVTTLYRLETGERRPDILVFQALCQRLGKTADYVVSC